MDDAEADALIADLYGLATSGAGKAAWDALLQRVAGLAGAFSGVLHVVEPAQGRTTLLGTTSMPEEVQRDYAGHYLGRDLFLQGYTLFSPDQVALSQDYVPEAALLRSEIYSDLLRPRLGDAFYNAGIFAPFAPGELLFMGLQRPRRAGPYAAADAERLRRLWPHLTQAVKVARRLRQAEDQAALGFGALDSLAGGVVVLDGDRRLHFANRAAERLLRQGGGMMLRGIESRLHLSQPRADAALAALVARAARPGPPAESATMRCPRPDGLPPLALLAVPFQPQRALHGENAPGLVLLLITDPLQQPANLARQVASLFQLTPAEAAVAAALAAGHSPEEIAAERQVRLTTVRSQVKSLMAKTETRRQGELLRLILSLPQVAPQEEP
jgi:DNA-binding CsgD family transcriptional regulator/PAS domain-containing protein